MCVTDDFKTLLHSESRAQIGKMAIRNCELSKDAIHSIDVHTKLMVIL